MVTRLYKFQREDVQQVHRFFGRALIANEMGTGKTVEALAYVYYCMKADGPVVVVCPASIKWNWQNECLHHFGMRAIVLEGKKPPKSFGRGIPKTTLIILNYDILSAWLETLKRLQPKLIIGDEVHYIKTRSAQRTKAFKALCEGVKKVILMSGTPLTNRPTELWPSLNILRPDRYPSFFTFANRYSHMQQTPWGMKFLGAQRLPELHETLVRRCMIRRTKAEVLSQLPKKTRIVIPIDLRNYKEYETAEKDFVRWLRKTYPQRRSKNWRAERMVKMGYLKRLVGQLKLRQLEEWIDNFLEENDGKLLVFGVHRAILHHLHERYKHLSVLVTGQVKGKERQNQFDRFTKQSRIRVFFGNIIAAGIGWNATAANTVLFAELDWVPGNHIQAEDRIHRIGQFRPSTCFYLVARNTIEELLVKVIQKKQEVLDQTLDGKKGVSGMDIYDQIETYLLSQRPITKRKVVSHA